MSAFLLVYLVHYLVEPLRSEVSCFNLAPVCYPLETAMLNARRHACPPHADCQVDCSIGDGVVLGRRARAEALTYDLLPVLSCQVNAGGRITQWRCSTRGRRCSRK